MTETEMCGATQTKGHMGRDHHCIGERGHPGRHWCLLGHGWTDDEEEES